jgi:P27 family predicted phage terminase small subunit
MGKRGPTPKPTSLKVLQGNPGKRKINKSEPKPQSVIPKPPNWLDDQAKKIWRELGKKLHSVGCITEVDWPDFAVLCSAISRFKAANDVINEKGLTFEIERYDKDGNVISTYEQQRPEVSIVHKNSELIAKLSGKFGMSPADRVGLGNGEQQENDFLTFLKNRGRSG